MHFFESNIYIRFKEICNSTYKLKNLPLIDIVKFIILNDI